MSRSMLAWAATALSLLSSVEASYLQYSTVDGFFLQDVSSTDASTFDYTSTNFGLINQTYSTDAAFDPSGTKTQWERFENYVNLLNSQTNSSTNYKILYIGRHGEGWHNVGAKNENPEQITNLLAWTDGDAAWNCYWSELDGNGTIVWADAHITPNGIAQAQIANTFWTSQIANQKQSLPQSYYTSPLSRCLETVNITFSGLTEQVPTVKELFREGISMHTCDRRSNKTYIHDSFPTYDIEAGFTEDDELWKGFEGETSAAQDARSKTVLDEVFSTDSNTFLSITTHSGEGASLLRVLGHRTFSLVTGAVIPVLVEARVISGSATTTSFSSWSAAATCTQPPLSTLTNGACVCPSGTASSTVLSTSPASINATITSTSSLPTGTGVTGSSGISSSAVYTNSTRSVSCSKKSTSAPSATSCPVALVTKVVYTTGKSTVTLCAKCSASALCPPESTKTYTTTAEVTTAVCPVSTSVLSANGTSILPTGPVSTTLPMSISSIKPSSNATVPTASKKSCSKSHSISSSALVSASTASATKLTTSTVTTTDVVTISKCAPTVTDCPYTTSPVVSTTVYSYTTVCPVTETEAASSSITTKAAPSVTSAELTTSSATSTKLTTSTVTTTDVITISKCAPTVTDCPYTTTPVVSTIVYSYTTVCPVTETESVSSGITTKSALSATSAKLTTSTVVTTEIITISQCASTVTNCPFTTSPVLSSTVYSYTTVCPVTEIEASPSGTSTKGASSASSPVQTGATSAVVTETVVPVSPSEITQVISVKTTATSEAASSVGSASTTGAPSASSPAEASSGSKSATGATSAKTGSSSPPYTAGNSTTAIHVSGSGISTHSSMISTSTTRVSESAAPTQTQNVVSTGGASKMESGLAAAVGLAFAVLFL
ncbi:hypothetical protein BP5796_06245 [Coleophoma crateriformis]|uniref:Phosphoglycerate mutase-like protein n=1 Tax=Coleophoma crateriformis TaxID=565419 RepID=A0A3D8RWG2_9HELO|nr:hypothetical protein BP5796_06245 [Coleophoma crateriformis]